MTEHTPNPDASADTDLGHQTGTSTEMTRKPNLSTEYQKEGGARLPKDTLDKDQEKPIDDGGRKSSFLHNE